jgi:predicted metal-dependent peptidase
MTTEVRLDEQRVAAARLWAAMRFPYLASAVFASKVVPMPKLGSIAADRSWRMYMDPDLVNSWSCDEVGSMLIHQVGHLLRDHAGRAEQLGIDASSQEDWVAAADAEINDDLVEDGVTLPVEQIVPSSFECENGGFAEDYFRVLRGKNMCPGDCGSGAHAQTREWELDETDVPEFGPGDSGEAPQITEADAELLRHKVASDIRDSAWQMPGSVPLGWQRWAEELLNPKVDWRKALAAAVRTGVANAAGRVDYSYMRPSRRTSVAANVILPSLQQPVPNIAVVVDTSGSMSRRLLADVVAEVEGILRDVGLGRRRIHLLTCDTEVHKTAQLTSTRQVQLFGSGGTDMGAGIAAALELRPRPSVIVVLTDGETPWPSAAPKGTRVVVGIVGRANWPVPDWATTVYVDDA